MLTLLGYYNFSTIKVQNTFVSVISRSHIFEKLTSLNNYLLLLCSKHLIGVIRKFPHTIWNVKIGVSYPNALEPKNEVQSKVETIYKKKISENFLTINLDTASYSFYAKVLYSSFLIRFNLNKVSDGVKAVDSEQRKSKALLLFRLIYAETVNVLFILSHLGWEIFICQCSKLELMLTTFP